MPGGPQRSRASCRGLSWDRPVNPAPDISVCIVSTDGREDLLRCLDSVFAHPPAGEFEVLVLDNASTDGTAAAVSERFGDSRRAASRSTGRRGKAENDSALMSRGARELVPAAERGLRADAGSGRRPARRTPARSARRASRARASYPPGGAPQPSAWRFPGVRAALAGAVFAAPPAHRAEPRRADAGGGLGAVGRDAGATRGVRAGRPARPRLLRVLGRGRLAAARPRCRLVGPVRARRDDHAPRAALARHRVAGAGSSSSARNRDRYMRKHHGPARPRWRCGR